MKAPWITYRPELKVLDCTVRDGGLINNHKFKDEFVKAVYDTCVAAGVDYMEIGYKNSDKIFSRDEYGDWRFCDENDIRRIVGENETGLKLSAMADAGKSDWATKIVPADESPLDLIRVACYAHQISEAKDMVNHCHAMGYEVACNIMAVSTTSETELDQALEVVAETPADYVCVVDSFGSLYAEQIELLVKKYITAVEGKKTIGIHAHNNQQLAFANTIEAIIHGANIVDATMMGIGRGAGNCPMELLLGFLRNPKFDIRPVWQLLQDYFIDLQNTLDWGPSAAYNITGQLNEHPRTAIALRESEDKDMCADFYNKIIRDI